MFVLYVFIYCTKCCKTRDISQKENQDWERPNAWPRIIYHVVQTLALSCQTLKWGIGDAVTETFLTSLNSLIDLNTIPVNCHWSMWALEYSWDSWLLVCCRCCHLSAGDQTQNLVRARQILYHTKLYCQPQLIVIFKVQFRTLYLVNICLISSIL